MCRRLLPRHQCRCNVINSCTTDIFEIVPSEARMSRIHCPCISEPRLPRRLCHVVWPRPRRHRHHRQSRTLAVKRHHHHRPVSVRTPSCLNKSVHLPQTSNLSIARNSMAFSGARPLPAAPPPPPPPSSSKPATHPPSHMSHAAPVRLHD